MPHSTDPLPISDHFALKTLASGVYAAIGTPGGAAYSNAGIVDLGDHTLIFDTFDSPLAADDLQQAAEELTGRPVSFVIISHVHSDHWLGAQVFDARVPIIATHKTREMMPGWTEYLLQAKEDPSDLEQELQEAQKHLDTETDPRRRASLQASIPRLRHWLAFLPTLEPRLPNWTFDGQLIFHGTHRRAELLTQGKGHTESDAYLVLPDDGIMFMGDLGFFQSQPFIVYADPQAWDRQLEEMVKSDIETFVPGHGPLGAKADLALQREYVTVLQEMVAGVIKAKGTVEEALQQPLPAPFDAWLMGGMARFEANVRATYERLSAEKSAS